MQLVSCSFDKKNKLLWVSTVLTEKIPKFGMSIITCTAVQFEESGPKDAGGMANSADLDKMFKAPSLGGGLDACLCV